MLQRPTLRRASIALPLLAAALILMATVLPEHATLLWGFGLLLLVAGLVAAVATWNQRRMPLPGAKE